MNVSKYMFFYALFYPTNSTVNDNGYAATSVVKLKLHKSLNNRFKYIVIVPGPPNCVPVKIINPFCAYIVFGPTGVNDEQYVNAKVDVEFKAGFTVVLIDMTELVKLDDGPACTFVLALIL